MEPDYIKRAQQSWCPICRSGPAGPDCPDKSISRREAAKKMKRKMRQETRLYLGRRV